MQSPSPPSTSPTSLNTPGTTTPTVETPTVAIPGTATPTMAAVPVVNSSSRRRPDSVERFERQQRFFALFVMMSLVAIVAAVFHERWFRGLSDFRAMDSAQVARHVAAGHGFVSDLLRPDAAGAVSTRALVPDMANAPLWPLALGVAFSFMDASDRTASLFSLTLFVVAMGLLFTLARRVTGSLLTACLAVVALALSRTTLTIADSGNPIVLATVLLFATLLLLTPRDTARTLGAGTANAQASESQDANAQAAAQEAGAQLTGKAATRKAAKREAARAQAANRKAAREVEAGGGVNGNRHFWAGVLAAACCLCDYPLVFLVVPLVFVWNRVWRNWKPVTIAMFMLGFVLAGLPWAMRNMRVGGAPFPASAWLETAGLAGAMAPLASRTAAGLATLVSALPLMPHLVLAPFIVLALFLSSDARGVQASKWGLLAAIPIYFVALGVLGRAAPPALLPMAGLLSIVGVGAFLALLEGALENWRNFDVGTAASLAGGRQAIEAAEEKRRRGRRLPRLRFAALSVLSLLLVAPLLVAFDRVPRATPTGIQTVLEPLGQAIASDRYIVTDLPAAVAWYGNRKATAISLATAQRLATRRVGEQTSEDRVGAIYLSPVVGNYKTSEQIAPWQRLWQAALTNRGGGLPNFNMRARPQVRDVLYVRQPGIEEARKLVKSRPKDARALFALAQAQLSADELDAGRQSLRAVLLLQPNRIEAHLAMARIDMQQKKLNEAAARFATVLKLAPRSLPGRLGLAEVRLAQNQNEAARVLYESVLADSPNQAVAMNNLAFIYAANGRDLSRATEMARRALATAPQNAAMLDTLGWVYTRSGRAREGVPFLREAVKSAPQSALTQSHLGQALIAINQKKEAATVLRRALKGKLSAKDKAQAQAALSKALN